MPRKPTAAAAVSDLPVPSRPREQDELTFVPVLEIADNPKNPRRRPATGQEMAELGDSVRAHGVLEPLIVRLNSSRVAGDEPGALYQVVAGQRRLTVARALELEVVPVVVKDLNDEEAFDIATNENIQRADMHPLDEAEAFAEIRKRTASNAGVAARVGKTDSYVFRRLQLLELEKPLLDALREDRLSLGHAEALLRLAPAKRKIAADPKHGVVWSHSPLLDYNEKWTPQREDLRPLHDLERFIRDKSFFDPAAESVRHFQPELGEKIDEAIDDQFTDTTDDETALASARASMVQLSDDSMARMRLGARPNDPIPLTPSKWREVKGKHCPHEVTGVVVHGGPARVLQVCTKRSCLIHWPAKKKAKPSTTGSSAKRVNVEESWEARNKRVQAERAAEAKRWATVLPDAKRRLINHLGALKLDVPFVKVLLDQVDTGMGFLSTDQVKKTFGVSLTSTSIATVVALASCNDKSRSTFAEYSAPWRFDMKPIDAALAKLKADEMAAAKKAAPAKKAKRAS